jgi:hypothetical protein
VTALRYWPLALIAVSGIVGAVAWGQYKDRLRAEGRAELHLARADSMETIAVERRNMAEAIAIERDSLEAAYHAERARVDSLAQRERTRRPEIIERIVHAPDTTAIRRAVAELEASHEAEVQGYVSALAVADSLLVLERETTEALGSEVRALREVNANLRAAIGDRSGPGFVESWGERALWALGGAVACKLAC